jgi:galactokinase
MTINTALSALESAETKKRFAELYGLGEAIFIEQKQRYAALIEQFSKRFGNDNNDISVFSSPGRSEIGGNHTDHNHGKVLAASINLDCIAVVAPSQDNHIHLSDFAYKADYAIDCEDTTPNNSEAGSAALIRGIVAGFKKGGFNVGGFSLCVSSQVIPASGVSSSAAFEMLICQIMNELYNGGSIPVARLAQIGQYAENVYWGKGSGLLDQMACGYGGMVAMDFEDPTTPKVEQIPFDFEAQGYSLVLVNTGGNHAELSGEYSAIPSEMKQVAKHFGKESLRGVSVAQIMASLPALRSSCGDRAIMRAFHFIEENARVDAELAALKANDFPAFLRHITASGNSSWKWLQNVYVPSDSVKNQSISVSLALTEMFINHNNLADKAACRIHGGGFAGVIQVFLPNYEVAAYKQWMIDAGFAKESVFIMAIRPYGVLRCLGGK